VCLSRLRVRVVSPVFCTLRMPEKVVPASLRRLSSAGRTSAWGQRWAGLVVRQQFVLDSNELASVPRWLAGSGGRGDPSPNP